MVQTQGMWTKTKTGSKAGFDKVYGWVDKLGAPINRLSNKLGAEAFWPTTLDKESDKAARILKSFCKDGFYQEEERPTAEGPKAKQRVLKKIPAEVIQNAKGIAIFTVMRTGLWISGAGGSGILVGRKEDGSWSPPSGIMLHTAGLGFLVGADIYDCVVVINTQEALDAFSKVRCTLGGEVSAVAGPLGVGGVLESEVHKRQAPIFTYLKSRGFYAGVQIDGTIVIERTDENERFYGERIGVVDILAGKARHSPIETQRLMATLKAAQGDTDVDQSLLPSEPPPADYEIVKDEKTFGVPDEEDPDPYGVLALETAGLVIREAGTRKRPTSEQFEFKPSPTSPVYNTFRKSFDQRSSIDGRSMSRRSSWRTSTMSNITESRNSKMVDMCTQTDFEEPPALKVPPALPPRNPPINNPITSPVLAEIPESNSIDEFNVQSKKETTEKDADSQREIDNDVKNDKDEKTQTADNADKKHDKTETKNEDSDSFKDVKLEDNDSSSEEESDEEEEEEPVIQEIHQAAAPQVISRARVVTVAKPIPPRIPIRNPDRRGRFSAHSDMAASNMSPPSTPSLRHDASSTSDQESISSSEGFEHISQQLRPKFSNEAEKKEDKDEFQSAPASPTKTVPGGFVEH